MSCKPLLCVFFWMLLAPLQGVSTEGVPSLEVDVSYLAVDMIFSRERGVKICEIQHGVPSTFKGEIFANGGKSTIAENLLQQLGRYFPLSWVKTGDFPDLIMKKGFLQDSRWKNIVSLNSLSRNSTFLKAAAMPVSDPSDLSAYHGFVFCMPKKSDERASFQKKYPGVVAIDNASYHYRRDKLMMSKLLLDHPLLEAHKPKWAAYPTKYSPELAGKILQDIDSPLLVIKPVGELKGYGVIIVHQDDLEQVLMCILLKKPELAPDQDPAYAFWQKDRSSQFIVEAFAEADPVSFPHLDGKFYSPSFRQVYLLVYNNKKIEVICLGGYYKLPKKSLEEEGSLNQKYKSCGEVPYYGMLEEDVMEQAAAEIRPVLEIVYQRMLSR